MLANKGKCLDFYTNFLTFCTTKNGLCWALDVYRYQEVRTIDCHLKIKSVLLKGVHLSCPS